MSNIVRVEVEIEAERLHELVAMGATVRKPANADSEALIDRMRRGLVTARLAIESADPSPCGKAR